MVETAKEFFERMEMKGYSHAMNIAHLEARDLSIRAEERERCAKIAEKERGGFINCGYGADHWCGCGDKIATAIRKGE